MRIKDPIWAFFSVATESTKTNKKAVCRFCSKTIKGQPIRMKIHLTKCEEYKKEFGEFYVDASVPSTAVAVPILTAELKKEVDELLARAVYFGNLPFSIFECNPYFKQAFTKLMPGYCPPSKSRIGCDLLDEQVQIANEIATQKILAAKFVTIETDGWSNGRSEGMINIVVTTPAPIIHSVLANGGDRSTADILAMKIEKAIQDVGDEKVVGIVTDNARNMLCMGEKLQELHEKLICIPCASHSFNIVFKHVMEIDILSEQWEEVRILLYCRSTL